MGLQGMSIRKQMAVLAGVASLGLGMAGPAMADVKAGVEAWSRGDYAGAVSQWRPQADKGDADAQFNLAQAYRLGRGVQADPKRAEDYYAKASAQGHLQASDNYGLMLFQDGRREEALPYVQAAAGRGDPRAQYLLGIAHFNGDLVNKDWVRAYALMSLAQGAGLPQAAPALAEMDRHVLLNQRQMGAGLVTAMQQEADARRAQEMAAADFAMGQDTSARTVAKVSAPSSLPSADAAVSPLAQAESAVQQARAAAGTDRPEAAGADFARTQPLASTRPTPQPAAKQPATHQAIHQAASPPAVRPQAATATAASGPWRLQLGAFSVAGNAERLWNQIGGKGVLSGKNRIVEPAGQLTKLFAGGFASQADAASACASLKRDGHGCLVTR